MCICKPKLQYISLTLQPTIWRYLGNVGDANFNHNHMLTVWKLLLIKFNWCESVRVQPNYYNDGSNTHEDIMREREIPENIWLNLLLIILEQSYRSHSYFGSDMQRYANWTTLLGWNGLHFQIVNMLKFKLMRISKIESSTLIWRGITNRICPNLVDYLWEASQLWLKNRTTLKTTYQYILSVYATDLN